MDRSEKLLDPSEVQEIRETVLAGFQLLGLPVDSPEEDIQEAIRSKIYELRKVWNTQTKGDQTNFILELGCVWGQTFCSRFNWEWANIVFEDEEELYGIVSPNRSHAILAHAYFKELLNDHEKDQTSFLIFNMMKADRYSKRPANTYSLIE